jgi:site-specific DNA recombinase
MKKVALYCRVSTGNQEKEETIDNQIEELKKSSKEKKWSIIKIYRDTITGSVIERPGLNQLREDAEKGLFDVVFVYDLTRLSRKLGHQIALIEELNKEGIEVEVLGENYENTPEGMLNRNIRGAFAEYERFKISQRFKAGKKRKLKNGQIIGCTPPYGYRYVKKQGDKAAHFEINHKEARVVKEIFKLYLKYQSIAKITFKLKELGYKSRNDKYFYSSTLRKILKREAYIGNWYYGKTTPCKPKYHIKEKRKGILTGRKMNSKEDCIKVKVPRIIDNKTFNSVRNILKENGKTRRFPRKLSLCSGLIRCVKCGKSYGVRRQRVKKKGGNARYFDLYRCSQATGSNPNQPLCKSRSISRNKLDTIVWNFVHGLLRDSGKIKEVVRERQKKMIQEKDFNENAYNSLAKEKKEIKRQRGKLIELFSKDIVLQDELEEKIESLKEKEGRINKQIREVEMELKEIKKDKSNEREIEKLCSIYNNKLNNLTEEQKRITVRHWVEEINILDDGSIFISCKMPKLEKAINTSKSLDDVYYLSTCLTQRD